MEQQMEETARPATFRVRDYPLNQRPRERLRELGAEALSDIELLAIVIGSGVAGQSAIDVARALLLPAGSWGALRRGGFEQLCQRNGIGPTKAAAIMAAIEIGRRQL